MKYYNVEIEVNIGEEEQRIVTFSIKVNKKFSSKSVLNKLDNGEYGYSKIFGYTPLPKKPEFVSFEI